VVSNIAAEYPVAFQVPDARSAELTIEERSVDVNSHTFPAISHMIEPFERV
jgi:hypothetical protein